MQSKTKQILADIGRWVDNKIAEAEPGERLPTIRHLMREFGTAQRTVEAALRPFLDDGRLISRPGAGIVVAGETLDATQNAYAADLLILYRNSDSRLARVTLQEVAARLKSAGSSVLQLGFSGDDQAIDVLERIGRFRACLIQVNFEILTVAFLAALHRQADHIVIDGVSATGIDVDAIGTNWREALSIAFRAVRENGHEKIAFLTSAHHARQIAMARREFELLGSTLPDPAQRWLIELNALPGSYQINDIAEAIGRHADDAGRLPFTALIVWGVVEGFILERALFELGLEAGRDLSVIMLGSTDFQSEHLGRFDVVGNSHAEKLAVFERIIAERIADRPHEPQTHYLPISHVRHGSVIDLSSD
ncbi:GntR family transcriptional regulator [Martelella radicis]|uniref:DNA-binding LacI/PurR family transcriptional regulator n=1 Tax=Martelella radicis TaxID=1397476 RepID=A0A7W6KN93_9HYPH|nr:GntR family transcriptional regulator [Martelella radicis]MBB4124408.1 DNA-binding LacI/PurR family transcriptional regulator [Martelella radicis]